MVRNHTVPIGAHSGLVWAGVKGPHATFLSLVTVTMKGRVFEQIPNSGTKTALFTP